MERDFPIADILSLPKKGRKGISYANARKP